MCYSRCHSLYKKRGVTSLVNDILYEPYFMCMIKAYGAFIKQLYIRYIYELRDIQHKNICKGVFIVQIYIKTYRNYVSLH